MRSVLVSAAFILAHALAGAAGAQERDFSPVGVVYFETGSAHVRPEFLPVLAAAARRIHSFPGGTVLIEGHCDERGTRDYNLATGEVRAIAVRRALVSLGVPLQRLRTSSYGDERPAVAGRREAAWMRNRRVEIKIIVP